MLTADERRAKKKVHDANYRAKHREHLRNASKEYHESHKESVSTRKKAYYQSNKDTISIKEKVYKKANTELLKDPYVAKLLYERSILTASDIHKYPELIELKRAEVLFKREIRKQNGNRQNVSICHVVSNR